MTIEGSGRSGRRGDGRVERQNVTLSLPREMVREVKILAARRDTSISGLMVEKLEEVVEEEKGYQAARGRSVRRLGGAFDLGTGGEVSWTRDESHER